MADADHGGRGAEDRVARRSRITAARLLLLAAAVGLAVVAGELLLRAYARVRPSVLFMRPDAKVEERIERSRYRAGTVRHGFAVNSGGHTDGEFLPRPDDRVVVACIGDSFSAGVVHHFFHFTTVAERFLEGVEVFNYGFPATDLPEYRHILVTEVLAAEPDLIVVNVFVGNDLTSPLPRGDRDADAPGLISVDNLLLVQVPKRLALVLAEGRATRRNLDEGRPAIGLATELGTVPEILREYPWYRTPMDEPPTMDRGSFLAIERTRAERLARQPDHGYRRRLELLDDMREAARGIPVAVMIIPDVFQVEDRVWDAIAPDGADQRQRMRPVVLTQRWLRQNDFPCLNLLGPLRAVAPLGDGERHLFKRGDSHFNARGNHVAGKALARFISEQLNLGPVAEP